MAITPLPPAPQRNQPATFADAGDAFLGALPAFAIEAEAARVEITNNAVTAAVDAATAAGAAAAAGAVAWVSGTTYAIGDARYSPIDFQTYRRKTAGAGTTDPSLDAANWARVSLAAIKTLNGALLEGVGDVTTTNYQEFTASGTWVKPAGCTVVAVHCVAGGGAGSTTNGGCGGGGWMMLLNAATLPASVPVVVGLGGVGNNAVGSDSSFGGYLAIGGDVASFQYCIKGPKNLSTAQFPASYSQSTMAKPAMRGVSNYGGAHQMGGLNETYLSGQVAAVYGGGGGGSSGTPAPSYSVFAGAGGTYNAAGKGGAGVFPGGGGGGGGASPYGGDGANGVVRVWAW